MVLLKELTSHGPHYWYVQYLIIDNLILLDFFSDGNFKHTYWNIDRLVVGDI